MEATKWLGNDIGGSLRNPANACGIASIRPSAGRVPDAGYVPAEDRLLAVQLMNVQGPMARRVADVRLGLRVLMSAHPRDPWSLDAPFDHGPVFTPRSPRRRPAARVGGQLLAGLQVTKKPAIADGPPWFTRPEAEKSGALKAPGSPGRSRKVYSLRWFTRPEAEVVTGIWSQPGRGSIIFRSVVNHREDPSALRFQRQSAAGHGAPRCGASHSWQAAATA
jgi:hypothetical protein